LVSEVNQVSEVLHFFVDMIPVPQGSKKCFCRGRVASIVEAATGHAAARKLVTKTAKEAIEKSGFIKIEKPHPVVLHVEFVYIAPKARKLIDRIAIWRTVAPDVDKLTRLIGDSLTDAGVYSDDAQIAALHCFKYEVKFADAGRTERNAGIYVWVGPLNGSVGEHLALVPKVI